MKASIPDTELTARDGEELKDFSRSMAELQWLLLILALLYFIIPTRPISNPDAMLVTMVSYAAFVIVFRYLNFQVRETRWKLALETWAMIGFITLVNWVTGMVESPLLNLYLLVIIACAITLGKVMTILEVMLIACAYLYMSYHTHSSGIFSPATFTTLMAKFSPFMLVAYVTSMLAADLRHAKNRITALSRTDDLTGLLNMRAFNTILEKEIATAARYACPFTVVMVDVDRLKQVNDRHGHSAGNRLVKTTASLIRNCIRSADIAARFGGDEFIILMPHTGLAQAGIAAERIRAAIENTSFDMKGKRIAATVSIGIASYPECIEDARDVLDKADVALYRSKRAGRNRVAWYDKGLEAVKVCA